MPSVIDIIIKKPNDEEISQVKTWPIWTCDVSTFDWDYTQSETCLLVEGKVSVQDRPGEEEVTFGAGDMVVFPKYLACVWKVSEPVKKHYNFE